MPSLIYDSALEDEARGDIDFDNDAFRVMLCSGIYTPNKGAHTRRSDVKGEIVAQGYAPGGAQALVTVKKDTTNHRVNIELGGANWPTSTITARCAVYYKDRGGMAALDELVAVIDFGKDIISTAGMFSLTPSTLRIQN